MIRDDLDYIETRLKEIRKRLYDDIDEREAVIDDLGDLRRFVTQVKKKMEDDHR